MPAVYLQLYTAVASQLQQISCQQCWDTAADAAADAATVATDAADAATRKHPTHPIYSSRQQLDRSASAVLSNPQQVSSQYIAVNSPPTPLNNSLA